MNHDLIVEEIYLVREKLFEECNGNLDELIDSLRKREEDDRERIISMGQLKLAKEPRSATG